MVFEAPGRSNVRVWSSRAVVCKPRRPGLTVEGAQEFVERAQKRLVAHDAQRKALENELAEGEARVQRLQVLVEAPPQVPPPQPSGVPK